MSYSTDDVIGGLAGGIAGLFLLVGVTSCICLKCRKRKNRTGKYCGTVSSYNFRRGTCTYLTNVFKMTQAHQTTICNICTCVRIAFGLCVRNPFLLM